MDISVGKIGVANSLGEKLPECVFGHGWLLQNGDKMSKWQSLYCAR